MSKRSQSSRRRSKTKNRQVQTNEFDRLRTILLSLNSLLLFLSFMLWLSMPDLAFDAVTGFLAFTEAYFVGLKFKVDQKIGLNPLTAIGLSFMLLILTGTGFYFAFSANQAQSQTEDRSVNINGENIQTGNIITGDSNIIKNSAFYLSGSSFDDPDVQKRHDEAKIFYLKGLYDESELILQELLTVARVEESKEGQSLALLNLGWIYNARGEFSQAKYYFEQALEVAQETQNIDSLISINQGLSNAYYYLSDYEKSDFYSEEANKLQRDNLGADTQWSDLHQKSALAYEEGNYQEALALDEKALELAESETLLYQAALSTHAIGTIHNQLGNYDVGIPYLKQALEKYQLLENSPNVSDLAKTASPIHQQEIYFTLGTISFKRDNDVDSGVAYFQQAIDIAIETDDFSNQADLNFVIGTFYFEWQLYDEAIPYLAEARFRYNDLGDRQSEMIAAGNLGGVYEALGENDLSLTFTEDALLIAKELQLPFRVGRYAYNAGIAYYNLGNNQNAILYYKQALAAYEKIEELDGLGITHNNIGLAYKAVGDTNAARSHFKEALRISEETNDRTRLRATAQNNLESLD
ncbi:MAG: tetratricopeptide repeat protein [Chloroflexi bacterium]|nr:tetratricopeptide repeat protein [Chloroflexota bacterium]